MTRIEIGKSKRRDFDTYFGLGGNNATNTSDRISRRVGSLLDYAILLLSSFITSHIRRRRIIYYYYYCVFSYTIPKRWKYELEALIPGVDRIVFKRFSHEVGCGILSVHYCMPGAPITQHTHTHTAYILCTLYQCRRIENLTTVIVSVFQ